MLNEKGGITEGEIAESALAEYEHGADAADDVALEVWKEFGKWCSLRCSRSLCGRFGGEVLAFRLLAYYSEQTAVERGDGFMPAVRISNARQGVWALCNS